MNISDEDRERISAAIKAAEAKTSGEIVCVLARASCDAVTLPMLAATVIALALPWPLVWFTAMPVDRILLLQIFAFVASAMILSIPSVRLLLVPRRMQRAVAHRVALYQFHIRGIARKQNRCGILIFVSMAERYVRIVADTGIAAQVPQSHWQGAVDALAANMRNGQLADGFVAAIEQCGAALAAHFPRSETSRDELSDRIHVL